MWITVSVAVVGRTKNVYEMPLTITVYSPEIITFYATCNRQMILILHKSSRLIILGYINSYVEETGHAAANIDD